MKQKNVTIPGSEVEFSIDFLTEGGFDPTRIRFLVYGESGIGKTRFASTFPKPFFFDIDDGMASVDIPVARRRIHDWDELVDTFEWISTAEHDFETVVVDSLNEAQVMALSNTVEAFPNIRRSYESLPSQSDYGKMLSDFDNMARHFKSLPAHVVFIAQVTDKEYEIDTVKPQMIGKHTSRNICRMMDIVTFLYRDGDRLAMSFAANDFVTKDRSGTLPPTVHTPSYKSLAEFWTPKSKTTRRTKKEADE
jgi:phage nucleotide-binding protein